MLRRCRRRSSHLRPAALALVAAAAGGCSLFTSYADFSGGGEQGDPTCGGEVPPDPGGVATSSTSDAYGQTTFISFSSTLGGGTLGVNLDGHCDCPDAGSCVNPAANEQCGVGIDNGARPIVQQLFDMANAQLVAADVAASNVGLLLHVRGYDGQDVEGVGVALYNVLGKGDSGALVDPNSLLAAASLDSKYSASGFVKNGQLVARFLSSATVPLRIRFVNAANLATPTILPIHDAVLLGTPELTAGGTLALHQAQLVGRLDPVDVVGLAEVAALCPSTAEFGAISSEIASATDIALDPGNDGKALACTGISVAIGLEFAGSAFGGTGVNTDPTTSPCNDAGATIVDAGGDSAARLTDASAGLDADAGDAADAKTDSGFFFP